MPLTSRAIVMAGDGTWQEREFLVPDPPAGGGILRVEAVGLCHSDIDHLNGIVHTPWGGEYPSIPGHEIVGRIHAVTDAARAAWGVEEGDRVAVRPVIDFPKGPMRVYGHDFSIEERSGLLGGVADYMELLPETRLERLPDSVSAEELTVWEPLSIAVGWAGAVSPGDSVAILGPGHLGLATIAAVRAAGAERVFVTGTGADSHRLAAARRVGADETIDATAVDAVQRIRELSGGGGVDVVIDAAAGATATVVQAMQMVRNEGSVVIGAMKNKVPIPGFISDWIPSRRISLLPGWYGDPVGPTVDLLRSGKVPTQELLGEVLTLDRFGEALALLDRKLEGRDAVRVGISLITS